MGFACSGAPDAAGRPTHARTSKPVAHTRSPTDTVCSMRKVLSFTHATRERTVSTSPYRAGDEKREPDSTMGTPTISYFGNASGQGRPSEAKSDSQPRSY